jgi:glycosyltransferase involved in cell wall biosynthesis
MNNLSVADPLLPLVTIVTPSYNQGQFIRETIESVLTQDYPNIEYIVTDGASTDNTAEVVAPYLDRLTFFSEKDRGQTHAINKGFALARGEIVAWLNSDDIFLPGAISRAVTALQNDPSLGMVYGEGYQMDAAGNVTSRFQATQRFDLWRLTHLSDYILQQTVFFRKSALDAVGPLDESLYYVMDWEIFIRIGKRFSIGYIPEYMGSIREYETAKTFSGGGKRIREIAQMLRRHGKSFPISPGHLLYGLTTYEKIWTERIAALTPAPFARIGKKMQSLTSRLSHRVIAYCVRDLQGWYGDDWASGQARLMLQPARNRFIEVDVALPEWAPIERQTISFVADGRTFARETFGKGTFTIVVPTPPHAKEEPFSFTVQAKKTFASPAEGPRARRLAYLLHGVRYREPASSTAS